MTTESAAIRVGSWPNTAKGSSMGFEYREARAVADRVTYASYTDGQRVTRSVRVNMHAVVDPPRSALAAVRRGGGA